LIEAAQIVSAVVPLQMPGVKVVSVPLTVSSVGNETLLATPDRAVEFAGIGGSHGAEGATAHGGGSDAMISKEGEPAAPASHKNETLLSATEREIPLEQTLGSSLALDYFTGPHAPGANAGALLAAVNPQEFIAPSERPGAEVVTPGQQSEVATDGGRGWVRRIMEPLVLFVLGTGAGYVRIGDRPAGERRRAVAGTDTL
jgi:hypothetical protein